MNRKITLALIFLLFTTLGFAQFGAITIKSENGEKFYLFVNNQQLNQSPKTAIFIPELREPFFHVAIKFANPRLRNIELNPLTIADANGQLRHVTYKLVKSKRSGKINLKFVSMVPVDRHMIVPKNVFVAQYFPIMIPEPVEPQQPVGCINGYRMGNSDFQNALATVKNQSFDDTRQKIARQIVSANCMSTDQIIQVAGIFGFDDSKLDFAKFAYEFCTDPQNYYKVSNVFGFSSSAEELSDYVQSRQ